MRLSGQNRLAGDVVAEPLREPDRHAPRRTISTAATTLTTGAWLGRNRLPKIHNGSVCTSGARGERRDDDLVEAQPEREQRAGDERAAHRREGDEPEGLPARSRRDRPRPPPASRSSGAAGPGRC